MARNIQEWLNEGYVQIRLDAGQQETSADEKIPEGMELLEGKYFTQDGVEMSYAEGTAPKATLEGGQVKLDQPAETRMYMLARMSGQEAEQRPASGFAVGQSGRPMTLRDATEQEKKVADEALEAGKKEGEEEKPAPSAAVSGPVPQPMDAGGKKSEGAAPAVEASKPAANSPAPSSRARTDPNTGERVDPGKPEADNPTSGRTAASRK